MTLGQRVKAEREAREWSQTDLAERVGVRQQSIDQVEKDQRVRTPSFLPRMAEAFGVNVRWLETGAGKKHPKDRDEPETIPKASKPGIVEYDGIEYAAIPRFDMQASAGHGRAMPGSPVVLHRILFRMQWIRRITNAPIDQLTAIEVDGDSMEPTLRSGDMVLVDLTQKNPAKRDAIYVLNNEEDLQIKRVQVHPATKRFFIRSDNPAYESWNDIDPREVEIVGRVIWMGRRI